MLSSKNINRQEAVHENNEKSENCIHRHCAITPVSNTIDHALSASRWPTLRDNVFCPGPGPVFTIAVVHMAHEPISGNTRLCAYLVFYLDTDPGRPGEFAIHSTIFVDIAQCGVRMRSLFSAPLDGTSIARTALGGLHAMVDAF